MFVRLRPLLALGAGLALLAPAARASCGAASCPIEIQSFNAPTVGHWSLDLSYQYIDQDRPRIGTHGAQVGEIPSEHDEVRTINRTATLNLRYALSNRFELGVTAPWISRFHEHLEEGEAESWHLNDSGDVSLQGQARLWNRGRQASLWLTAAVELPTGPNDLKNDGGERAEPALQPGSGSTDATLGLALRGQLLRDTALEGPLGHTTAIPWFAAVSYRRNGKGDERYRLGDELLANAGVAYPLGFLVGRFEALFQLNARFRGKDSPGSSGEDPSFTGGTYLYASPGLRVSGGENWGGYVYVQLPLYQDVHKLQLVSRANWLGGVQMRF